MKYTCQPPKNSLDELGIPKNPYFDLHHSLFILHNLSFISRLLGFSACFISSCVIWPAGWLNFSDRIGIFQWKPSNKCNKSSKLVFGVESCPDGQDTSLWQCSNNNIFWFNSFVHQVLYFIFNLTMSSKPSLLSPPSLETTESAGIFFIKINEEVATVTVNW